MTGDTCRDGDVSKRSWMRWITVEPLAFVFTFGQFLSFPTTKGLTYKKSCLINFNESFCELMNNKTYQKLHSAEQDVIQDEASYWTMLQQITLTVPNTLVVFFFLASWGDKVDRKIPILLPLLGGLMCNVVNFMSSYYIHSDIRIMLLGTFLNGTLGTFSTFLMGIYTYIVYVASLRQKTVRVGIVEAMVFMAGGISVFVSGLIRQEVGFTRVYIIIMAFQATAILYTVFCLRSVKPVKSTKDSDKSSVWCVGAVTDMIAFLRKKREGKTTLYIYLYVVLINLMMLGTAGENDILYLFLRRAPRSFDGVEYGYFKGAESFSRSLTLIVLLPVLKHVLKWRDTSTLIIGVIFKGIQFAILGFAKTLTVVFIALIFATLQGFPAASIRSSMSKLVDQSENGRLFGLVAATEGVISLAASFLFNGLYPKTFDFFDGILFECIVVLSVFGLVISIYLRLQKADLMDHGDKEKDKVSQDEDTRDEKQTVKTQL